MADDRLDDAIDAVVRAVDRIERATRGVLDTPLPTQPYGAQTEDVFTASRGPGTQGGFGATNATAPSAGPVQGFAPPLGEPSAPPTDLPPYVPASAEPVADALAASPEVHELIGRIVGRTQVLEEHLEAARVLRAELSELVSKLAAAATRA